MFRKCICYIFLKKKDLNDALFIRDIERKRIYYKGTANLEYLMNGGKFIMQFNTLPEIMEYIEEKNITSGQLVFYNIDLEDVYLSESEETG